MTLADLTPDAWSTIAISGIDQVSGLRLRRWRMDCYERAVLQKAIKAGAVITGQQRVAEDVYELRAADGGDPLPCDPACAGGDRRRCQGF